MCVRLKLEDLKGNHGGQIESLRKIHKGPFVYFQILASCGNKTCQFICIMYIALKVSDLSLLHPETESVPLQAFPSITLYNRIISHCGAGQGDRG